MHEHRHHGVESAIGIFPQLVLALPFLIALFLYIFAVFVSNRKYKNWPIYRTVYWALGVLLAIISVSGPLAERAHGDFVIHMLGHLFLGMLAPLFMALAAPMTLFLRSLEVQSARKITKILQKGLFRVLTDPIVASLLNVGGLWVLYTTNLYTLMHESMTLHVLIHFHVFLAGYVFTISIIYIDPIPHRTSYLYRSIVLLVALAAHGILSKYIYANPPMGVSQLQAEQGGKLMYYGGDAIDIVLIFILCLQWYKSSRPKIATKSGAYSI